MQTQTQDVTPTGQPAALTGIRVVDLSRFIAGPYCAMILGDMGADVIKVEKPGRGDPARGYRPQLGDRSVYSLMFNRNKRGLALDLRTEAGLATLKKLLARADIVIENFRPGTMEKMGLGWEDLQLLNPRLTMVRISGFGQDGPWAQYPAFDGIAQALGGLMDLNGPADGPPTLCGTFICDYSSGMYAAMGALAAINARHASGRGQLVDVALLDAAASLLMSAITEHVRLGNTMTRRGSRDRYASPNNVYQTAGGDWVYLIGGGEDYFPRLARAIGRPELLSDPNFATLEARRARWDETENLVRDWMKDRSTDEVMSALRGADVPCGRVATVADVAENPQLRHRGQIVDIDDPHSGTVTMQGVTIKMSGTPLTIRRHMPAVGEHDDEILSEWLGEDAA